MSDPIAIQLKQNLFRKGNNIISYETVVARIEGDKLIELGKFSRTTSKHICYVAQLYRLQVVAAKEKKPFYALESGSKCALPNALSLTLSKKLTGSLNSKTDLIQSLAKIETFGKRDWPLVQKFLRSVDVSLEEFRKMQETHKILEYALMYGT